MRCGSQEPRIKLEPPRLTSDGPDATELYAYYASQPDKWQQDIVDCWLGKDDNGNYNVTSASETLPRQNGKNVTIGGLSDPASASYSLNSVYVNSVWHLGN